MDNDAILRYRDAIHAALEQDGPGTLDLPADAWDHPDELITLLVNVLSEVGGCLTVRRLIVRGALTEERLAVLTQFLGTNQAGCGDDINVQLSELTLQVPVFADADALAVFSALMHDAREVRRLNLQFPDAGFLAVLPATLAVVRDAPIYVYVAMPDDTVGLPPALPSGHVILEQNGHVVLQDGPRGAIRRYELDYDDYETAVEAVEAAVAAGRVRELILPITSYPEIDRPLLRDALQTALLFLRHPDVARTDMLLIVDLDAERDWNFVPRAADGGDSPDEEIAALVARIGEEALHLALATPTDSVTAQGTGFQASVGARLAGGAEIVVFMPLSLWEYARPERVRPEPYASRYAPAVAGPCLPHRLLFVNAPQRADYDELPDVPLPAPALFAMLRGAGCAPERVEFHGATVWDAPTTLAFAAPRDGRPRPRTLLFVDVPYAQQAALAALLPTPPWDPHAEVIVDPPLVPAPGPDDPPAPAPLAERATLRTLAARRYAELTGGARYLPL